MLENSETAFSRLKEAIFACFLKIDVD